MANENCDPVFRDVMNDFLNERATESVNGRSGEVHQREDRWICTGCGMPARDRFRLAQCEASHGPEEYIEDWRAEEAALDLMEEEGR